MRRILLVVCILGLPWLAVARQRSVRASTPTFSNDVVRIFQQNCQTCHHAGGIAPFSLMTYADALPYAQSIKSLTRLRLMPPWKAALGCGDFAQERRLSEREIATLAAWADDGAPEGDRKLLPKPLEFDGGWSAGSPDLVLAMPKSFTPPADRDEYRCFSIPTGIEAEQWLSAIDFRPGDPTTVHHIVVFLDAKGVSASMDKDGTGFQCFGGALFDGVELLGAWSPGARPNPLPDGTAVRIPRQSRVVMQVHYHPHGSAPAPDRTEMALYYTTWKVLHAMHYDVVLNTTLAIPPNTTGFHVKGSSTVGRAIHIVSIYPHMHLLGRSMNIDALLPDGSSACLIQVPQYDFQWQGAYVYKTPLALPAGSQLRIDAMYDNYGTRTVRWGEGTEDEMCVAIFGYTVDEESAAAISSPSR